MARWPVAGSNRQCTVVSICAGTGRRTVRMIVRARPAGSATARKRYRRPCIRPMATAMRRPQGQNVVKVIDALLAPLIGSVGAGDSRRRRRLLGCA